MKNYISFFLILFPILCMAQKQTRQRIDAEGIEVIEIAADEVFKIEVKTAETDIIEMTTEAEGEYFNNIGILSRREGNKLIFESTFNKILENGFDKLSAHKVFSIKTEFLIPKNLNVEIASNIASVMAFGDYKNLQIQLKQGNCEVMDFSGNAVVNTYSGDVFFTLKNLVNVEAISRKGTVKIVQDQKSGDVLKLTSISGNIEVRKSK